MDIVSFVCDVDIVPSFDFFAEHFFPLRELLIIDYFSMHVLEIVIGIRVTSVFSCISVFTFDRYKDLNF